MSSWLRVLVAFLCALACTRDAWTAPHSGQVTFNGLPVPGATVTASQGDRPLTAITNQQGVYQFADLADGTWMLRVDMVGFEPASREVAIGSAAGAVVWELRLLPFEAIAANASGAVRPERDATGSTATASPANAGFRRAPVSPANPANPVNSANPSNLLNPLNPLNPSNPLNSDDAADGLLVNGSVNNGAASPFAQLAAFGNDRRGTRSLYNGGVGVILGNSAWDARPFSFAGEPTFKPEYRDVQIAGIFGGPIKIPGVIRNRPNLFLGFQRSSDHNASTQSALVPTLAERSGDFSQSRDAFGRPIQLVDPKTGRPFAGNVIPAGQISPEAAALLNLYPRPNVDGATGFNYQAPILVASHQESVQVRITQPISGRTQMFGNLSYQRSTGDSSTLFGFHDATTASTLNAAANWARRFGTLVTLRLRYQLDRSTSDTLPFFAYVTNVSGLAGINGNNQDPANWGPPGLTFSGGIAPLSDVQRAVNSAHTHTGGSEALWTRGRHNVTAGGSLHAVSVDVLGQQDPRGTFGFTGASTGSDVADFLVGLPQTSTIAYGNADKFLRATNADLYITDDWRLSPGLTINAGVRWEYEAPMHERLGRLVNLDVAPGFTAVTPVVASDGSIQPDRRGVQPRVGVAWRPIAGSSVVVRAAYGVYRNTNVYQPIDLLLAQQPPLSKAMSVETSPSAPLTLANGFLVPPVATPNTFAVDPRLRVGLARNWQVSMQRDLPASLTMIATYLGAHGSHLLQEFLPNTYPAGAVNPCPSCPAGFVYLTSDGESLRHAAQFELRRRLRAGLTATAQYTLAKATDNAGAFTGVSLTGPAIAQDWLNLEAERAPSNFDQRHVVTAQFDYTTGVGVRGGGLLTGVKGTLIKGWTFTGRLTTGSGLPVTPVYLTPVSGTGVTGTVRAELTGRSTDDVPAGAYANPAAYAAPSAGQWGSAGRNSIRGPAQFTLNAGVGRSFPIGERFNLDWRLDATNVLNQVTYAGIMNLVGSPQFGLPNRANTMRKIQSTMRLRF